jgi:uncharacterized membrane protein
MKLAKPLFASFGVAAAMAAVSGWALTRLPGAPIPAHWGIDGRPDRFADPALVLFTFPAIVVLLGLLFAVLPAIMPPRGDLERSRGPYVVGWIGTVVLLLAIHLAIVATALGVPVDMPRVAAVGVGGLLVVLGNYLPKMRFNYVMGIRTPWTLADERVWDRTQRFAGLLTLLSGAVSAIGGLLIPDPVWLLVCILAPILTAVVASVVYSALISPRVGGSGPAH